MFTMRTATAFTLSLSSTSSSLSSLSSRLSINPLLRLSSSHSPSLRTRPFSILSSSSSLSSTSISTPTSTPPSSIRNLSTTTRTPEEMELIRAQREARKAEKEQAKLDKAAKKLNSPSTLAPIDAPTVKYEESGDSAFVCGDYELVASSSRRIGRVYKEISSLSLQSSSPPSSTPNWYRGRVHSLRINSNSCFLVLRQGYETCQFCFFKNDMESQENAKDMLKYLKSLTCESVIDIYGVTTPAEVNSCTVTNAEVQIKQIHLISRASAMLPFGIEDASRSDTDVEESQSKDRPFPKLGQEIRLDNRWMDLRTPANGAIMRIQSGVCKLFRESLYSQGFMEIHSPKLIGGESESGSGVFKLDYFGTEACLAQSPQLYKQMAISGDLGRVFEVGPVFRAEKSHTRRHLCEFTGLDIEMCIGEHYMETLEVVQKVFRHIFDGLEKDFSKELKEIRKQFPSEPIMFTDEPCVIHWTGGMDILESLGFDVGDRMQDLSGAQELALGAAVKEKYGTDFFMLDKYPASIRPFYTMPCPDDKRYSNSYDMFIRGQEICSGAQRCHDVDMMLQILKDKNIATDSLQSYLNAFRHGIHPHAGAGIGLERVVFLYLGLDNVRKASLFPRDPTRLTP